MEKILESGEEFPSGWPVQGNTGYDFLGVVNNLLTCADSKKQFTDFYRQIVESRQPVENLIYDKKADILYRYMAGELENLCSLFIHTPLATGKQLEKIPPADVKAAMCLSTTDPICKMVAIYFFQAVEQTQSPWQPA